MGGLGSGRWGGHATATTAEECRVIDLAAVVGRPPAVGRAGVLRWTHHGQTVAAVGFALDPGGTAGVVLRLTYRWADRTVELGVALERVALLRGGARWWGRCPLARAGTPGGRRVGKLYLPPGSADFGCRACHRLAYTSSRRHDRRVDQLVRDPDALHRLARNPQAVPVTQLGLVLRALDALQARYDRAVRRVSRRVEGTR